MITHLVIVPTYNEIGTIDRIVEAVMALGPAFQLLVVDDGSPDGTAERVDEAQRVYPDRVFLMRRAGKLGIGTAYVEGFKWALARQKTYIYEMDADFSHPPEDLKRMAEALETGQADLVIGSRYINGVRVINWPIQRLLLSYFASLYTRWVTQLPVWDTTAGFIGYRSSLLDQLNLNKLQFKGYVFQIAMKYLGWRLGATLLEIPIVFHERQEGYTKLSSSIFWEAIFSVLWLPLSYKRYLNL